MSVLKQRDIQVSVSDKFSELQQSGKAPVCLFPKRKACDNRNAQMLRRNASELHEFIVLTRLTKQQAIGR